MIITGTFSKILHFCYKNCWNSVNLLKYVLKILFKRWLEKRSKGQYQLILASRFITIGKSMQVLITPWTLKLLQHNFRLQVSAVVAASFKVIVSCVAYSGRTADWRSRGSTIFEGTRLSLGKAIDSANLTQIFTSRLELLGKLNPRSKEEIDH